MEVHWKTEDGRDVLLTDKSTLAEIKRVVPFPTLAALALHHRETDFTVWKYKVMAKAPADGPPNREVFFVPVLLEDLQKLLDGEIKIQNILHPKFE